MASSWKPADSMRLMTHEIPRVEAREIVTGRAKFSGDIQRPGMLFARWDIALPPAPRANYAEFYVVGDEVVDRLMRSIRPDGKEMSWTLTARIPEGDATLRVGAQGPARVPQGYRLVMEMDGARLDTSRPIRLPSGIHELRVFAKWEPPAQTRLLANYPNPFNPETWIPFELQESANVAIRIYDAGGNLVRELDLGHREAGYYTTRSEAAYWDGRNAFGESVASGLYLYELRADNYRALRRMLVLK